MSKHTAGPWEWFIRTSGEPYLATPNRGHLTVMDFVRKGINLAQPRFATWKGEERERMGGIMVAADKMNVAEHPDARLMAAAPELLQALEYCRSYGAQGTIEFGEHAGMSVSFFVENALAKASE